MYTTYDIYNNLFGVRDFFEKFLIESPFFEKNREYPYVNLYEKGDDLEIRVVAPGLKVGDINLELVDHSLLIELDKKSDYEDKPYIRKERKFGKFKRSVKLPYRVDANNINATMKNGILSVKLTKSDEAKPKKITIK